MSRVRLALPAMLTAVVLALAGCAGGSSTATPNSPASSAAAGEGEGTTTDADDDAPGSDPASAGGSDGAGDAADQDTDPAADESDLPVSDTDPDGGAGPDDDAVTYENTGSVLAPECGLVILHPLEHEVLEWTHTETDTGFECYSLVDSKGDALTIFEEIAASLDAEGYEQTSKTPGDSSADAVNVLSYLIGEGELHVTVQQTGPTGLHTHYAFVSPARGNG